MSTLHAANIYQDKEGVSAGFILLTPTCGSFISLCFSRRLAPVFLRVDFAIHRKILKSVDTAVRFVNTYPLDSHLSVG